VTVSVRKSLTKTHSVQVIDGYIFLLQTKTAGVLY